jgi:DNA-binding response OmpR family regulator
MFFIWIEDDTDVVDPVVRPLERAGHHFIRLHTVREARAAMEAMRQADLILLDIALPPISPANQRLCYT